MPGRPQAFGGQPPLSQYGGFNEPSGPPMALARATHMSERPGGGFGGPGARNPAGPDALAAQAGRMNLGEHQADFEHRPGMDLPQHSEHHAYSQPGMM